MLLIQRDYIYSLAFFLCFTVFLKMKMTNFARSATDTLLKMSLRDLNASLDS